MSEIVTVLGNHAPKEAYREPDSEEIKYRAVDGQRIVTVKFPEGTSVDEMYLGIVAVPRGIWVNHALWTDPEDTTTVIPPVWVTSDEPLLAELLARKYGCTVGAPADLEETYWTENGPPGTGPQEEAS